MRNRKWTRKSKGMAMAKAHRRSFLLSDINFETYVRKCMSDGTPSNADGSENIILSVTEADDVITLTAWHPKHGKFVGYLMNGTIEPKTSIDKIMKYFAQETRPHRVP